MVNRKHLIVDFSILSQWCRRANFSNDAAISLSKASCLPKLPHEQSRDQGDHSGKDTSTIHRREVRSYAIFHGRYSYEFDHDNCNVACKSPWTPWCHITQLFLLTCHSHLLTKKVNAALSSPSLSPPQPVHPGPSMYTFPSPTETLWLRCGWRVALQKDAVASTDVFAWDNSL